MTTPRSRPSSPSRARCLLERRATRAAAGARRQGARGLERAGHRGPRRGRATARGGALHGRGGPGGDDDRGRAARRRRVAQAVVEGRPRGRFRRARGLRPPRRGPAGAVRDDVRRALVLDRARPRGPDPGAVRRPGGRLLRHRDRPRAPDHPAEGPAGQRRAVGWGDGDDRAPAAGGVDRGGALSRGRGTGARHGLAVPGALPDGVRAVARGRVVRGVGRRRGGDRRRPGGRRRPASCSGRSGRRGGRTRCWPWRRRTARPRPRCRCCTTASPSTAVPTAYVCRNFACNLPVTDAAALAEQLQGTLDPA